MADRSRQQTSNAERNDEIEDDQFYEDAFDYSDDNNNSDGSSSVYTPQDL